MSHLHHKVSALIDGELQGGARRRALAHASSCDDCQRELEQTYALKQRLLGLAAAEPPADLFAALGSVRSAPRASTPRAGSRVAVATRRVLIGAGSMSLAVVTLAYAVGGSEPATATVDPPVGEFSAEFADSTGLAALSDPAVEVLSDGQQSTSGGTLGPVNAFTSIAGAVTRPSSSGDDPAAVQWLRRSAAAPSDVAYTAIRTVTWLGPSGESSVALAIEHAPQQGTSFSVMHGSDNSEPTFITRADAVDDGALSVQPVDLLLDAYDLSSVGSGTVDGRAATVVEASRDGGQVARFWIDQETGLLLQRALYDGNVMIRMSTLTHVRTQAHHFMSHLAPELEAPSATRLSMQLAPALTDQGWACPLQLPGDFRLTFLHHLDGAGDVVHAAYSDGLSTVSVFEEHGQLDTSALGEYRHVVSGESSLWVQDGLPTVVLWQADGMVYTLLSDAPMSTTAELVAALPHRTDPASGGSRLSRGLERIASYVNPAG